MKVQLTKSQLEGIINEHFLATNVPIENNIEEQIEYLLRLKKTLFLYSSANEDLKLINSIIKNLKKVSAMEKSR
jgi:hypothetical protein